jgi:hypothetical protein
VRHQGLDQAGEVHVEEDDAVVGVVGDVGNLLGEQARIDGVADRGHARDGEIDLEMAMGVPGQRADAVLGLDTERLQHPHQLARAAVGILVGIAVGAPDRQAGNDLGVAVVFCRVHQQCGNH